MFYKQCAPAAVALGLACGLFGFAVDYLTKFASCSSQRAGLQEPSTCSVYIVIGLVDLFGCGVALVVGFQSWCRGLPGFGVAGSLLSIAVWSLTNAITAWYATNQVYYGRYYPTGDAWAVNMTGVFWLAIAIVIACGAISSRKNQDTINRKEPWVLTGALGLWLLIWATTQWHLAAGPGLCGQLSNVGYTDGNVGYCVGELLSGLAFFLGFAILVFIAFVSLRSISQPDPEAGLIPTVPVAVAGLPVAVARIV